MCPAKSFRDLPSAPTFNTFEVPAVPNLSHVGIKGTVEETFTTFEIPGMAFTESVPSSFFLTERNLTAFLHAFRTRASQYQLSGHVTALDPFTMFVAQAPTLDTLGAASWVATGHACILPYQDAMVKKNVEPIPISDSTQIRPLCLPTIRLHVAKPIPVPAMFRAELSRVNTLKILSR